MTLSRPRSAPSAGFHVDLLGVFFMLWGALTVIIGTSTLGLAVAAVALIRSGRGEGQFAAGLTVVTFTALAIVAIVWGLVHLRVGSRLRRRHYGSRLTALMLGSVDVLLLPYGTALGAYSLWTLLREDAKALFDARPATE